jgi:hypothetical protein
MFIPDPDLDLITPIPDSGSRGQNAPDQDPQHWLSSSDRMKKFRIRISHNVGVIFISQIIFFAPQVVRYTICSNSSVVPSVSRAEIFEPGTPVQKSDVFTT